MHLSDLLTTNTITMTIDREDKQGVIEALLDLAMQTGKVKDREAALKAVLAREKLMSTGLEKGIAVPHAKSKAVDDIVFALGISADGIDFEAADEKPSHLFFFLMAPEDAAVANVKILGQIARLTSDPSFCRDLRHVETSEEALRIIKEAE